MELAELPPLAERRRDDMLTSAETAAYLGMHVTALETWRKRGKPGPTYVRLGDGPKARVRYPAGLLFDWIQAQTVNPSTGGETPADAA